ncbi:MAG: hydroxyethylthiazole kinase [Acidobacteriaceae bacterium]
MSCTPQAVAEVVESVRSKRPLVHHITNIVTVNAVANITLCIGALPVMAHAREEVEQMVEASQALVLNIGTLTPEQVDVMVLAGRRANERGIPVVLDPVGVGATDLRTASARRLMQELSIAIIRGNAAEIAVLAGVEAKISGVESLGTAADPATVAAKFARQQRCVAVVTGAVDVVTDGNHLIRIANGHPMMGTVTGTGCMATAVIGACAAVETNPLRAAFAALAAYGLAGELAATRSQGPGTFQVQLFDALASLTAETILAGAHITEEPVVLR